jgi:hypothetical protein
LSVIFDFWRRFSSRGRGFCLRRGADQVLSPVAGFLKFFAPFAGFAFF